MARIALHGVEGKLHSIGEIKRVGANRPIRALAAGEADITVNGAGKYVAVVVVSVFANEVHTPGGTCGYLRGGAKNLLEGCFDHHGALGVNQWPEFPGDCAAERPEIPLPSPPPANHSGMFRCRFPRWPGISIFPCSGAADKTQCENDRKDSVPWRAIGALPSCTETKN